MRGKELVERYAVFLLGVYFMSWGIAFSVNAGLGTSPISSVPAAFSKLNIYTVGELTVLLNVVMIVLQIVLLKKDFQKIQLLQLPISFAFGFFIDSAHHMLQAYPPTGYPHQMLYTLLGCVILALGIAMEVLADVVMMSGEALVAAICKTMGAQFPRMKVILDITLVLLAVTCSYLLFGTVHGVREGTIIAAFLVGTIVRFVLPYMAKAMPWN